MVFNDSMSVIIRGYQILKSGFWTQHRPARDKHGFAVPPRCADATTFCALGAVERAGLVLGATDSFMGDAMTLLNTSAIELFGHKITDVNDANGPFSYHHVLEVFEDAIHKETQPSL